jgi:putative membrane protein
MLKKLAAIPGLAFIIMVEPLQAIAQPAAPQQPPQGYYGPMPWHMWNGGYGEHGFWMLPLMMLFLLLVCAAFFAIARRSCGHGMHSWGGPANRPWGDSSGDSWGIPWGNPSHSALQILNERFARGEIQKEEYTEKKAALMSGGRA